MPLCISHIPWIISHQTGPRRVGGFKNLNVLNLDAACWFAKDVLLQRKTRPCKNVYLRGCVSSGKQFRFMGSINSKEYTV